jgi:hypothetical protein
MRSITVEKARLVDMLQQNLAVHMGKYDVAMERYQAKVREWFEENLARIMSGDFIHVQRVCPYPVPEKHDEDYVRALDMLAWDLGDTYELTESDFQMYVNDDWGWARTFAANTASYLVEQA